MSSLFYWLSENNLRKTRKAISKNRFMRILSRKDKKPNDGDEKC